MGRTNATTRNDLVEAAGGFARQHGLAALNMRALARGQGVSVGTLYNYFPDKAALVAAVIERFWERVAFAGGAQSCMNYRAGERLVDFCRRTERTLAVAVAEFRTNWLGELGSLDPRSRQRGREVEQRHFGHICANLEKVALNDADIDQAALARIGAKRLSTLIWRGMLDGLRRNEPNEALFTLLELALYRPVPQPPAG